MAHGKALPVQAQSSKAVPELSDLKHLAEGGDAAAEKSLGEAYHTGLGAPQDDQTAAEWLRKAALQGDSGAATELGDLYSYSRRKGRDSNLEVDDSEAAKWYRVAADKGDPGGCWKLAEACLHGYGIGEDQAEAMKWYLAAADHGSVDALLALGNMFRDGGGVKASPAEAAKWYEKAAALGNAEAEVELGTMHRLGKQYGNAAGALPKSDKIAVGWYRKAAEQGDSSGQVWLAYMYRNGLGVQKDDGAAIAWYQKAAALGDIRGTEGLNELKAEASAKADAFEELVSSITNRAAIQMVINLDPESDRALLAANSFPLIPANKREDAAIKLVRKKGYLADAEFVGWIRAKIAETERATKGAGIVFSRLSLQGKEGYLTMVELSDSLDRLLEQRPRRGAGHPR
ncbi:MAG: sel1 repeat family protein [Bacteroidetes bacterium]|nr:sel1 repeat family protein [Bacteroidota bacterium]